MELLRLRRGFLSLRRIPDACRNDGIEGVAMNRILLIAWATITAANAAIDPADSVRGEQLFTSLHCIQCHSVNGNGGHVAADLGLRVDRNFTPAMLAGTMWNHAPTMWAAMY